MNYVKTALLLVILAAILIWIGGLIGGPNGALIAFIIALAINGISYWFSDRIVLAMYRAKELPRDRFAGIYHTVEGLCLNAGIPSPRIYMIGTDAPNAFATGRNPKNAALCLTKGILDILDEKELEGVISHELAHIKNRDILIMTVTATLASSIMMLAHMARWAFFFRGVSGSRSRDSGNIIGLLALTIVAPVAAILVQLAISRSREYAADATGAAVAGSPEGLARALEDMSRFSKRSKFNVAPQTAHLFIVSPLRAGAIAGLFSTHPPIEERVKRLRSMA